MSKVFIIFTIKMRNTPIACIICGKLTTRIKFCQDCYLAHRKEYQEKYRIGYYEKYFKKYGIKINGTNYKKQEKLILTEEEKTTRRKEYNKRGYLKDKASGKRKEFRTLRLLYVSSDVTEIN